MTNEDLETSMYQLECQLADMAELLKTATAKISKLESQAGYLKDDIKRETIRINELDDDSEITLIKRRLRDLELITSDLREKHPDFH